MDFLECHLLPFFFPGVVGLDGLIVPLLFDIFLAVMKDGTSRMTAHNIFNKLKGKC